MVVQHSEAVQQLPGRPTTNTESRSGRISPISLGAKQQESAVRGNPHAAFDEAGGWKRGKVEML
jgi:hypothetical protein